MSRDETFLPDGDPEDDAAPILHTVRRMSEHTGNIRVVELDTLDRHGGKALMVHLPSSDGRSRVAFVPVKAGGPGGPMTEGLRLKLLEDLLTT